jgi:hypothetical protein
MQKKEMVTKIQETEKVLWKEYQTARALAFSVDGGAIEKQLELAALERWIAVSKLMDKLEIEDVE